MQAQINLQNESGNLQKSSSALREGEENPRYHNVKTIRSPFQGERDFYNAYVCTMQISDTVSRMLSIKLHQNFSLLNYFSPISITFSTASAGINSL